MLCPRRSEGGGMFMVPPSGSDILEDGTCGYCGSISEASFLAHCLSGGAVVTTTKNYKIYVEVKNPDFGKIVRIGSQSGPCYGPNGEPYKDDLTPEEIKAGRFNRVVMGPASEYLQKKFYFQHLSEEGQIGFIKLMNEKKLNFAMNYGFTVLPFFVQ